jgi:hypothetical protein
MKSKLTNHIGYSGELSVKLKSGDNVMLYTMKNAGHKALWDAAAKAFAGYDVTEDIPRYIDVVMSNASQSNLMVAPVPFTGVVYGEVVDTSETSTSVLYTATVTAASKLRDTLGQDCKLLMLNSHGQTMAIIEHDSLKDVWSSLSPGIDIIFEWKLTFSNNKGESNNV